MLLVGLNHPCFLAQCHCHFLSIAFLALINQQTDKQTKWLIEATKGLQISLYLLRFYRWGYFCKQSNIPASVWLPNWMFLRPEFHFYNFTTFEEYEIYMKSLQCVPMFYRHTKLHIELPQKFNNPKTTKGQTYLLTTQSHKPIRDLSKFVGLTTYCMISSSQWSNLW